MEDYYLNLRTDCFRDCQSTPNCCHRQHRILSSSKELLIM